MALTAVEFDFHSLLQFFIFTDKAFVQQHEARISELMLKMASLISLEFCKPENLQVSEKKNQPAVVTLIYESVLKSLGIILERCTNLPTRQKICGFLNLCLPSGIKLSVAPRLVMHLSPLFVE